jgi:hypothetical protein
MHKTTNTKRQNTEMPKQLYKLVREPSQSIWNSKKRLILDSHSVIVKNEGSK